MGASRTEGGEPKRARITFMSHHRSSAQGADDETHNQQNKKNEEQDFGEARRQPREAEEAKISCDKCKQKKDERPAKQK